MVTNCPIFIIKSRTSSFVLYFIVWCFDKKKKKVSIKSLQWLSSFWFNANNARFEDSNPRTARKPLLSQASHHILYQLHSYSVSSVDLKLGLLCSVKFVFFASSQGTPFWEAKCGHSFIASGDFIGFGDGRVRVRVRVRWGGNAHWRKETVRRNFTQTVTRAQDRSRDPAAVRH